MKEKFHYFLCIFISLICILWVLPKDKEAFNYEDVQGQP